MIIIKDIQIVFNTLRCIAQKDIKVIKKTRSAQKPTTEALKKIDDNKLPFNIHLLKI